jgi:dTMP kinase
MGVFAGIAWINGFTMIGHEVSDQLRGRVFAFVMSSVRIVLLGTIAAGPVLAGAIGSYQVRAGDFRFDVTGPAIVLAVGGLIAFLVSLFIGRQIGGLTSGLTRRIFGRRGVSIWDEQDNHAGVLIAVESADPLARAEYAGRIEQHLDADGWRVIRVHSTQAGVQTGGSGMDSPAQALRASADLADLTTERVRPALQAGAVVVCEGFVDATIVAHRTAGVEEQRFARVAQWAVNGLKADLTVLVDGAPGAADPVLSGSEAPVATTEQPTAADAASDLPPAQAAPAAEVGPPEIAAPPLPDRMPEGSATEGSAVNVADTGDDDETVLPVQAYRDRASYTPERYLLVRPLAEEGGVINPEVVERITSVLRQRSPSLAEPQPAS